MTIMTNAEAFQLDFGIYATELWAMPEEKFLEWLNGEWACADKEPPAAVPVVRCKDCRHRNKPECPMCDYVLMMYNTRFRVIDRAEDNGFCYMGERKDNV